LEVERYRGRDSASARHASRALLLLVFLKPAQKVWFWGGYGGYFKALDDTLRIACSMISILDRGCNLLAISL